MLATIASTVLIVEDDLGIAELEKARLEDVGHHILLATNTDQAIRVVTDNHVDLILLDYRLPGNEDGLQFFERIRTAGYDVPVILVTGFSNEATVIRALRAGVRDFVTKSIEYLDYLPEAVGRVLHQVNTEHKLAHSEARLASIIRSARDAIIVTDGDHRIILFNPAAEQMFQCPVSEANGRSLTEFIPPEIHGSNGGDSQNNISVTLQIGAGTRGIKSNGEEFPLEASVSRGEAAGRRFHAVVVRDVTERRRADERIREQAALIDQASDAILVRDLKHNILFWNRGAENLYGWTSDEAIGRNDAELLGRSSSVEPEHAQEEALKAGSWSGELKHFRKDGKEIIVQSRQTLLRHDNGQPNAQLIINTDITEKRKLEAQLFHAQRLDSIGLLASGIAHDFNNLLTVISGYSELLLERTPAEADAHPLLREIQRAGESAASMTRQLLAFGRKQILAPQILSINHLVIEMEKMLRRLIGADIELAKSLDPSLGQVRADPGQIEQVILNLVVNARDATPSGGRITLETRNVELDAEYASKRLEVNSGWYVMLAVSDTGSGMDEATKTRIFEPFFTTKEVGKGTGLGLATVHGIIKQSGGHIEVYSEVGQGTCFKVYLPLINKNSTQFAGKSETAAARGNETILIVEDDERVLGLARLALVSNGYCVLEATNGEKALRLAESHPQKIDLLLTDLVMPQMNGRELVERLAKSKPGIKVLYTSGYTDDAVVRNGILESGVSFLQKPFTPGSLLRKMREILDKP